MAKAETPSSETTAPTSVSFPELVVPSLGFRESASADASITSFFKNSSGLTTLSVGNGLVYGLSVLTRGETIATVWVRAPPVNFLELG